MFWSVGCLSGGHFCKYLPSAGKTKGKNGGLVVLEAKCLCAMLVMTVCICPQASCRPMTTCLDEWRLSGLSDISSEKRLRSFKTEQELSPLLITVSCDHKGPWGKGYFLQWQASNYLPGYYDIWDRNQCKNLKEYSFLIWRAYFNLAYTCSLKYNKEKTICRCVISCLPLFIPCLRSREILQHASQTCINNLPYFTKSLDKR